MFTKAYLYLKNDVEKQRVSVLLMEILVFIVSWAYFCFLYLTNPIDDIYDALMDTFPYITTAMITLLSVTLAFCFILTSAAMGEVTSRIRMKITSHG